MTSRQPGAIVGRMSMRKRGTRDELASQLDEMSVGWWHLGKDDNSRSAFEGADQLRNGASSVRVGHTLYEVDEPSDVSHT